MTNNQKTLTGIKAIRCQVQQTIAELEDRYVPHVPDQIPNDAGDFSSQELLQAIAADEAGDSWLFVELHKGQFVYDHAAKTWYEFRGQKWEEDTTKRVFAAVDALIDVYGEEARTCSERRIQAEQAGQPEQAARCGKAVDALTKRIRALQKLSRKTNVLILASVDWSQSDRESLALSGEEWDRDPWLLGCRNGVIDLRTGDLRPGRPEDYIKVASPTEWQGLCCPAPILERFLNEIFDGDTHLISYVQRLLGMGLIGLSVEHVFFIMWGRGRNGKSTLLEILGFVLGDLAGPIEAEMLLDQGRNRRSGGPTSDIMALRGRRLVWASETGEDRKLDPGKLKWLTGGDSLTGREMYGRRQVSFRPTHTFSTDQLPAPGSCQ